MIEGVEVPVLIDSGSSVSLISSDFRMSVPALRTRPLQKEYIGLYVANGQMLDTLGTIRMTLRLGSETWQHTFHVIRSTTQAVLLGWDFLVKHHALLDTTHARLQLWHVSIPLLYIEDMVPACCNVSLASAVTIPPLSEVIVPVKLNPPGQYDLSTHDFVGYLEPNTPESAQCAVACTVTAVKNGLTSARVLNPTDCAVPLKQGTYLGEFYSVTESDIEIVSRPSAKVPTTSTAPAASIRPAPVSLAESPLSGSQEASLSALLARFSEVFNTDNRNTGRCTLLKHHIRTGDQAPFKQRAYRTSPGKREEIERQVAGLLADGVIE